MPTRHETGRDKLRPSLEKLDMRGIRRHFGIEVRERELETALDPTA